MKKIFTFIILAVFPAFILSAVEWNISSDAFKNLGTLSETTVINGLTIYAHSGKTVQIDANNKSLEGMDFTHRLKLGGIGDFDAEGLPLGRVLSIDVTGNVKITVFCMSSSSDEDRILKAAFNTKDSILMDMHAPGAGLAKSEYNYSGEAGKVLLYSPGSGVNIYYIKVEPVTEPQANIEWNISNAAFNALGSLTSTVTVEGLTIFAAEGKNVDIDGNEKTLEDWSFTHRLKLGGSGAFNEAGLPENRVLAFDVTNSAKITIALQSSSGSADRILNVAVVRGDSVIAQVPALGASISKGVVEYQGGPATIFLYSPSSGVNIYLIKVEPLTSNTPVVAVPGRDVRVYPNPAEDQVFVKADQPSQIAIYSIAGIRVKSKWVESANDPIPVHDLPSGVYIIRSLTGTKFSQKLIVK